MRYAHLLMGFASQVWAMEPAKLSAVIEFLTLKADGVRFDAGEIEARIAPAAAKAVARKEGSVAILPVRGVIANRMALASDVSGGGGTTAEGLGRDLKAALDNPQVKAIVLDVDSPGGSVSGIDELSAAIFDARGRKPLVAQINATAASAAYWIVSAADEIAVTPSGAVGSIGVYGVHDDVSAALEKLGVRKTLIAAGKHKAEALSFLPLEDDARAHLQSEVNAYYDMFVGRVAKGRGVSPNDVRNGFGQGRMVMARDAVSQGMADRISTMDETLARFGVEVVPAGGGDTASGGARAFAAEREKRALTL